MSLIKSAVRSSLSEMGIVAVAEIQSNAPVDTGELRRSYTFKTEDFTCIIGTNIDYSVWVEFKPNNRGGRPHFKKSVEGQISTFKNILTRHLGGV